MDIVDRLLSMSGPNKPNVCSEAAEEIVRLRALVEKLTEKKNENG